MGGYFIYDNSLSVNVNDVKNIFIKRGFAAPLQINKNNYTALFYSKIIHNRVNYYSSQDGFIVVVGTLFYKGLNFSDSMIKLFEDMRHNKIETSKLYGNYTVFYEFNNEFYFFTDPANIYNVFYDTDKNFMTSSFLASIYAMRNKVSLNKEALLELLSTGSLIPPDTIFNEIKKLNFNFPVDFSFIKNATPDFNSKLVNYDVNYNEAVNTQLKILESYAAALKSALNDNVIDLGLTGGYDSRLLLLALLKSGQKISVHSHFRTNYSKEYECAKNIASNLNLNFNSFVIKSPIEKNENELLNTLHQSFLFCDGQILADNYWIEDYNTLDYRKKILTNSILGINGIGGEQYRNSEQYSFFNRKFSNWLRFNYTFRYGAFAFLNKTLLNRLNNTIQKKTIKVLNLDNDKLNKLAIKRFINEVFNPARRTVRTSLENHFSYFLSPFSDYNISNAAYGIIKYLGAYNSFQEEMIKRLNPDIASIESDYGYNFKDGMPLKKKSLITLRRLVPDKIFYKYIYSRKNSFNSSFFFNLESKFEFVRTYVRRVENLELGININKLKMNEHLSPLVILLGYLLETLETKISNEKL